MNLLEVVETLNPTKLVVRVITSAWQDGKAIHLKKTIRFVKRQSTGINFLQEDATNIGDLEVVSRITNLNHAPDGVYSVDTCNHKYDWESGNLDDYDYRLVPIKESVAPDGSAPCQSPGPSPSHVPPPHQSSS